MPCLVVAGQSNKSIVDLIVANVVGGGIALNQSIPVKVVGKRQKQAGRDG
jgi:hypothetical protein